MQEDLEQITEVAFLREIVGRIVAAQSEETALQGIEEARQRFGERLNGSQVKQLDDLQSIYLNGQRLRRAANAIAAELKRVASGEKKSIRVNEEFDRATAAKTEIEVVLESHAGQWPQLALAEKWRIIYSAIAQTLGERGIVVDGDVSTAIELRRKRKLEDDLKRANATLQRVSGEISRSVAQIKKVVEALPTDEIKYEKIERQVADLEAKAAALFVRGKQAEATIAQVRENMDQIKALRSVVDADGKTVDKTIDDWEKNVKALGERLDALDNLLKEKLTAAGEKRGTFDTKLQTLVSKIESLGAILQSPELTGLLASAGTLGEQLQAINTRFEAVERTSASNSAEVEKLKGDLSQANLALRNAATSADTAAKEAGKARSDATKAEQAASRAELSATRAEGRLATFEASVRTNSGAIATLNETIRQGGLPSAGVIQNAISRVNGLDGRLAAVELAVAQGGGGGGGGGLTEADVSRILQQQLPGNLDDLRVNVDAKLAAERLEYQRQIGALQETIAKLEEDIASKAEKTAIEILTQRMSDMAVQDRRQDEELANQRREEQLQQQRLQAEAEEQERIQSDQVQLQRQLEQQQRSAEEQARRQRLTLDQARRALEVQITGQAKITDYLFDQRLDDKKQQIAREKKKLGLEERQNKKLRERRVEQNKKNMTIARRQKQALDATKEKREQLRQAKRVRDQAQQRHQAALQARLQQGTGAPTAVIERANASVAAQAAALEQAEQIVFETNEDQEKAENTVDQTTAELGVAQAEARQTAQQEAAQEEVLKVETEAHIASLEELLAAYNKEITRLTDELDNDLDREVRQQVETNLDLRQQERAELQQQIDKLQQNIASRFGRRAFFAQFGQDIDYFDRLIGVAHGAHDNDDSSDLSDFGDSSDEKATRRSASTSGASVDQLLLAVSALDF